MRSLKQYIVESVHTYDYTIKIAGEVDKNFLDLFKFNLKKFDPVEISDPKSLPIQKDPYGFPSLKNEPVTVIKARFRYPATEPMIQQMAQLLGHNLNYVRVIQSGYDDSVNAEVEGYENEASHSPVLTHEQMEEQPGAKAAAKAYGNQYLDSIKDQAKDEFSEKDIPFSGKKTPASFDPFKPYTDDKQLGTKSPMTNIKMPAKPPTGAMKG